MEKFKVLFKKSAQKELDKIPKQELRRVIKRIQLLAENPTDIGSEKLSGHDNKYRVRQGNYRIVYSIHERELQIWIIKVAHRKDIYRDL